MEANGNMDVKTETEQSALRVKSDSAGAVAMQFDGTATPGAKNEVNNVFGQTSKNGNSDSTLMTQLDETGPETEKNHVFELKRKNGDGDFGMRLPSSSTLVSSEMAASDPKVETLDSKEETDAFGELIKSLAGTSRSRTSGIISIDKDAWYYNMKHKHRGVALIFNHQNFEVGDLKPRNGTEVDCFNLGSVLQKLDFDVTSYADLTYKEMDEKIEYWSKKDYTDYDSIFVVVLSHGEQGIIYARDAPYKPEDKLWGRFTGEKCTTLAGKPKLFFIQACQGDGLDGGTHLTTQVDGGPSSFKIPNHADFLIAYSTIPGFYSWRNTQKGSWFIQALTHALDMYGNELDLLTILTFVNRRVAIDFESNCPGDVRMHRQKQIPCITSMLTRLVRFEKKNN